MPLNSTATASCMRRLMTARPAGIKLHAELCSLLGSLFTLVLSSWWWLLARVWPWLGPLLIMGLVGCLAMAGACSLLKVWWLE